MNIEDVREYTLSIYGVTEAQPFGDEIITFRIEGKIFVCLWLGGGKHEITGKQLKELKAIAQEEKDSTKAKHKILEKIRSFSSDVLSNIVANIITNPTVWEGLK